MFDLGWIATSSFNLPLIGIGNLSAGGTGKSPMVEFIVTKIKARHTVAVLSRGYKRKTAGYALANAASTALDIGDEPLLLYMKHNDVAVAVGEERIVAIPQLLQDRPNTEVIVLDDAFQHRYIRPGLDIILTDHGNLFTRDWFLPTGDLRDMRSSYRRAQVIVVTKCPADLDEDARSSIIKEINPDPHQSVFFTAIDYGMPYHLVTKEEMPLSEHGEVLLVSGIANPAPLKKHLLHNTSAYYEILYSDHHIFTIDDLREIRKRFESIASGEKIILTTEKDAMRLMKFSNELRDYPVYVIPIRLRFLFQGENAFTELICNFISQFDHHKKEI